MNPPFHADNLRILVIDDNPAIHQDFRKILVPAQDNGRAVEEAEAALFTTSAGPDVAGEVAAFEVDSAFQGKEGLGRVEQAMREGRPYAMAFVDVRMPPGWDGVETIRRIWEQCPELQVVICTAYSDYSWKDMFRHLGRSDSLVILKKPFDYDEVLQLAHALTHKWSLNRQVRVRLNDLDCLVRERTAELTSANLRLQREVEQRTAAQEALHLSEERFSKAFRASPMPLAILDRCSSAFADANDSFVELTALPRPALMQRRLQDLGLWRQPALWGELLARLDRDGRVRNQLAETLRPDGSVRQVLVSLEALQVGGQSCLFLIALDVTEQKQLENELLQSQKMHSVGQLAAGVAHDFNNLLTVIQGHATLHLSNTLLDPSVTSSLQEVSSAADRAAALTRQLLAFSRKKVSQTRPLEVAGLVRRLETMLRRLLGDDIELQCVCSPGLPPILGEETGVEQVLMNLVVNARDAMPNGGRITLTAEHVTVDPSAACSHPDARTGHFLRLSVADDGCGIPADVLPRIFEPFFTTKDVGKGTGLGLSTVYAVVKQHQGWLQVKSVVGQGSTFLAFFPTVRPGEIPRTESNTVLFVKRRPEPQGNKTVLLVEDESALRTMVAEALARVGYRVLQAVDGKQALQLWEESAHEIDLLLTDLVLPQGISGFQLARQLRADRKGLKTLYSSGHSEELAGPGEFLAEGVNYLPKPYAIQTLLETVRQCLDAVEVPLGTQMPEAYRQIAEFPSLRAASELSQLSH